MPCPAHDGNKAHELTQFLHDARLNAFEGSAAQLAKDAGSRELDHDFVAANFDELAIAAVTPQIGTNLLDDIFDELNALGLSSHRGACLS